jgi:hypothetical protein
MKSSNFLAAAAVFFDAALASPLNSPSAIKSIYTTFNSAGISNSAIATALVTVTASNSSPDFTYSTSDNVTTTTTTMTLPSATETTTTTSTEEPTSTITVVSKLALRSSADLPITYDTRFPIGFGFSSSTSSSFLTYDTRFPVGTSTSSSIPTIIDASSSEATVTSSPAGSVIIYDGTTPETTVAMSNLKMTTSMRILYLRVSTSPYLSPYLTPISSIVFRGHARSEGFSSYPTGVCSL